MEQEPWPERSALYSWASFYWPEFLLSLLALCCLLYLSFSVPILNSDEARSVISAATDQPFTAESFYNGYTHHLGYWLFSRISGASTGSMAVYCCLVSAASLFVVQLIFARYVCPGRSWRVLFGLLLVSTPVVIHYSRLFHEILNVGSLSLACAVLFTFESVSRAGNKRGDSRSRRIYGALGGAAFGHAAYVHFHLMLVPLALAIVLWSLGKKPPVRAFLAGFSIGFLPRIVALAATAPSELYRIAENRKGMIFHFDHLGGIPGYILGLLDGGLVYLKTTGRISWPVPPYYSSMLAISTGLMLLLVFRARAMKARVMLGVAGAVGFFILASRAISPHIRGYYFFPLMVASCVFLVKMAELARVRFSGRIVRRLPAALLILVIGTNLVLFGHNYAYVAAREGIRCTWFTTLGEPDQSCSKLDLSGLYEFLKPGRLTVMSLPEFGRSDFRNVADIIAAYYFSEGIDPYRESRGQVLVQFPMRNGRGHPPVLERDGRKFRRLPFDQNGIAVYRAE